ncbi:MAG: fibronectin type III domain-containing protein [Phycisphaerae bacterium]|jgi:hypothetical protein|nr:fibronectin type III domain-containing protein [Phycisphaerae bacterium]
MSTVISGHGDKPMLEALEPRLLLSATTLPSPEMPRPTALGESVVVASMTNAPESDSDGYYHASNPGAVYVGDPPAPSYEDTWEFTVSGLPAGSIITDVFISGSLDCLVNAWGEGPPPVPEWPIAGWSLRHGSSAEFEPLFATGPYELASSRFDGANPNGVWRYSVEEGGPVYFYAPNAWFSGRQVSIYYTVPDLQDAGDASRDHLPQADVGEPWEASAGVVNTGPAGSGAVDVAFYASQDAEIDPTGDHALGTVTVANVPGDELAVVIAGLSLDQFPNIPMGEYHVGWVIDPDDKIEEINEANNTGVNLDYMLTVGPPVDSGDNIFDATDLGVLSPGVTVSIGDAIGNGPMTDRDVDFYKFTIPEGGEVALDIDAAEFGSSLDSYLRLFSDAGWGLQSSDDAAGPAELLTLDSFMQPYLSEGTYYLGVSGYSNTHYNQFDTSSDSVAGTVGAYTLRVTLAPQEPEPVLDEVHRPIAGLEIRASAITVNEENTHTATGTIIINDFVEVVGWVQFNEDDQMVRGEGQVWARDVPELGDVLIYDGYFEFETGQTVSIRLNTVLSGLKLVGMDVSVDTFRLGADYVRLQGQITLPPPFGGAQWGVSGDDYIELSVSGGLAFSGYTFSCHGDWMQFYGFDLSSDTVLRVSHNEVIVEGWLDFSMLIEDYAIYGQISITDYDGDDTAEVEVQGGIVFDTAISLGGGFHLTDLNLQINTSIDELRGGGVLETPWGFGVLSEAGVRDGILDYLHLGATWSNPGVPIKPPFVFMAGIDAYGDHLAPDEIDAAPTAYGGGVELTAGPSFSPSWSAEDFYLLKLDLQGEVSAYRISGSGEVLVFGGSDPYRFISAEVVVDLYHDYGLYVSGTMGYAGILLVEGACRMDMDGNMFGSYKGTLDMPFWLGGEELANAKVYQQHIDDDDDTNDYMIVGGAVSDWAHAVKFYPFLRKIDWWADYEELQDVKIPPPPLSPERTVSTASAAPSAPYDFALPVGLDSAIFRLEWDEGDTDIHLTDPFGTTYTPANVGGYADVDYYKDTDGKQAVFEVTNPAGGITPWQVMVTETDGIGGYTLRSRRSTSAATITLLTPDVDTSSSTVNLTWADADSDSDATISLFYDTDREGSDGTLIVSGISEDDLADAYAWDTTGMTTGDYYVYAVIDDGANVPVVSYATGRVSVIDPDTPGQVTGLNAPEGTDTTARLTWDASAAADLDHYLIRLTDDAAGEFYQEVVSPGDTTEFILDGLTDGETYRVSVAAVDTDGHVGADSDPIVVVPGGVASVAPEAGQWDVFARPGILYQAQTPGDVGDSFTPISLPAGATLDAGGLFEWNVSAGDGGWYEVLTHVTDTDGDTEVYRYNLLADGTDPKFAPGAVQVEAADEVTLQITAPDGVDASGVVLYQLERDGGVVGGWRTSPFYEDTGLEPDTAYDYRVRIMDASPNHHPLWSAIASGRTLAATPGAPVLGEAGQTTAILSSLAADANPAGTEYAIYNATTDNYVAADGTPSVSVVWQGSVAWESATITGLATDTQYSFQTMARNADGIETVLGPGSTVRTARESDVPTVQTAGYSIDTRSVEISFSESVAISKKDLELEGTGGLPVDLTDAVFSHIPGSSTASLGLAGILPDGHYALSVSGQSVQDLAGNLLDGDNNGTPGGDYAVPFSVLIGDTDGDLIVDAGDYGTLMGQFGLRGSSLAADCNGDWRVDLADFAIMRGSLGNTLPPSAPAAALQAIVEPIAAIAIPVVPIISQPLNNSNSNDASDDSIAAAARAAAVDLLMPSPLADGYISEPQAISGGFSATRLQRAATGEYDLRPLGEDLVSGGEGDDLLADILAESPLAVPL